ncbi:TPA: hypothetical protein IAC10_08230 [Candidatus Scatousia excrementigallinarum]|uniref:Uncharacterized protein n=1 Tax=Candidatus Scatousia excrementigallinarum TaxID=2840935 RepID=A0A9D1EZX9_9BACT|nr:hypothetical protein [Candidatus Scatousia excrementigallinarum]
MTTIIGVNLTDRAESSIEFQEILTKYGCSIRTRIGLHHPEQGVCTNRGVVLLDLAEEEPLLIEELSRHWKVQTMKFD